MRLLLDDKFAPTTSEFGLVQASCDDVADWALHREELIQSSRGVSVTCTAVVGTLEEQLTRLLPLTTVERRRILVVPTKSSWTAVFDNGLQGGNASGLSIAAQELKCHAIRIVCVCDKRRYEARIFEMYSPHPTDFLNYVRTISVANDGGRWRFDQSGASLPEEDSSWYSPRHVKEKFTADQLALLLRRLGHEVFEESFYISGGKHLERHGPTAPGYKELQLSDVRKRWAVSK